MGVIVQKVDFSAFRGLNLVKVWAINEIVSGEKSPYDMTSKTIVLQVYDRSDPINLLYQLSSTTNTDGFVSFTFNDVQTDQDELVDYLIVEDPTGTPTTIGYGTASFLPIGYAIPFPELVANETPPSVVIPDSFIALKNYEWRLYLQKAISPEIADADVQAEQAWPALMNILIAKLVVYDYLLKMMKSLMANNTAADESNGNLIKSIQTGPTTVEYQDALKSLSAFLKPNSKGESPFFELMADICQLADRVRVYLPICNNPLRDATIPLKAGRIRTHSIYDVILNRWH